MIAELNARTGLLIWKAQGNRYGFTDPSAITVSGNRLWVTNEYDAGVGDEPAASTGPSPYSMPAPANGSRRSPAAVPASLAQPGSSSPVTISDRPISYIGRAAYYG
jgi:hypothetical protein